MAHMGFASRGGLLVVAAESRPLPQAEWEALCRECGRLYGRRGTANRYISVLMMWDGGGPDVMQRAQLLHAVGHQPFRSAIVTPSVEVLAAVEALRIFNQEMRCFALGEVSEALVHVGVGMRRFRELAALLQRLTSDVPKAVSAMEVLSHVETRLARGSSPSMDSGIVGTQPVRLTRKSLLPSWLRGA